MPNLHTLTDTGQALLTLAAIGLVALIVNVIFDTLAGLVPR